jgi:integrase
MIMGKRRAQGEGNITQLKDGRWQARIRLGKDKDGRPIRKAFYGATKKEAADKLAEYRKERSLLAWSTPTEMTVEELANDWLTTCHGNKSPTTVARREEIVRLHLVPHLGEIKVQKLEEMHIHRMLAALTREGGAKAFNAYATLRTMLAYALRMRLVVANPVERIEKPRVCRKELPIYDAGSVKLLLGAAAGKRLSALFVLACSTGMRQGELLGLAWDALDLVGGLVHVRQTLTQVKGEFKLKPPKSKAGLRTISLPALAVAALHEHRKAMLKEGQDVHRGTVFCTRAGTFIGKSNLIRQVWKPVIKKAGVPDQPFHSLRHSHASALLSNGESIRAVAKRLGHADPAMTLRVYAHVLPDEDGRLADRIQMMYG